MKQTAVEWQFEQLFNSFEKFNNGECTFNEFLKRKLEIREQAKEIEKQQLEESYLQGFAECDATGIMDFEQYYNETFNK